MNEPESVDAPTIDTADTADAASEMIPRTEAEKAWRKRDELRAEVRDLRAAAETQQKAMADAAKAKATADGDLQKQVEILQSELDASASRFAQVEQERAAERAASRASKIEAGVTSGISEAQQPAVLAMFRGLAAQLDDGEADADTVIKGAQKALRKLAPAFFEQTKAQAPTAGLFPSTTVRAPTASSVETDIRRQIPGFKKLL